MHDKVPELVFGMRSKSASLQLLLFAMVVKAEIDQLEASLAQLAEQTIDLPKAMAEFEAGRARRG